ncbi:putative PKS-NRPS protein [Trichoderma velutinum]
MQHSSTEPVAIVGLGCRFPGSSNTPSKLWDLICEKKDILKRIPVDRFNAESYFHEDGERQGLMNVKHAYTLDEDIREFDASFFKTNAREAEAMDPQQRILLETVYEALESGGFSIGDMQGSDTCVYVGSMTGDYHEMLMRDPQDMPKYMATGTARSILSNRISYFFDWHGPSMTIDTACSSSLVAVHEAVHALRMGTSKVACAAGANLILGPEMMISESKLHMLSPTGRSRMWDASADGYARGEGFGAVILKTLSQAIADKDNIHCIIRETGVNSDGRTNGITLPSSESQTALIQQTYARAGLDWNKDKCQYFEAHGTGTPAGDPIEARAIHDAFFPSKTADSGEVMYVGSVKTVVGHLEGCAGIAGLIKASEAVRRGVIPPNMLFEKLNPGITPYYKNLKVPQQPIPWPETKDGAPRRASVNSFGFGGTNAHAIIESYEAGSTKPVVQTPESIIPNPLLLSATSTSTLKRMLSNTRDFLASDRSTPLQDVLFTLGERRSQHAVRASFSGHSRERLIEKLQIALDDDSWTGTNVDAKVNQPRFLGVFTGQGAQWPTMGREILNSSPVAAETLQKLQDSLQSLPDPPSWTLKDQILADKKTSRLAEAAIAQPLCTAVQVMLVDLLSLAGVKFNVVLGHSSGEIGAAYAAGMISAEEAIRIAYYRGVHASLARGSTGKPGAMMAVGLSYDEASDFVEQNFSGRIDVAASNAPASVTLSGDKDAIGTFARLLLVDTAYHSSHMMPCSEPYLKSLAACKIEPKQPREGCTWFSSVYALTGEYWKDNMVNPVLFSMAVELAANGELPCDVAVEVGPHPALKGPFTQTYKQTGAAALPYQGVLGRGKHDVECLSETLGFLWTHLGSSSINFCNFTKAFDSDYSPQLETNLPAYPWDHSQSFWKESRKSRNFRSKPDVRHPLLGDRSTEDIDQSMVWRNTLRIEELPWLDGHRVEGQVIYPAAGYLVMALESCNALALGREVELIELYDVEIGNAIPLSEETPGVETLFTLKPAKIDPKADTTTAEWACYSPAGDLNAPWRCNASGSVRVVFGAVDDDALPRRAAPVVSLSNVEIDRFYTSLTEIGLNYTGPFRALEAIHRKSGMSSSTTTQTPVGELPTIIHPAILDAAFQSIFAAFCWPGDGTLRGPFVPTKLRKLRIVNRRLVESARFLQVDSYITESSAQNLTADLDIFESSSNKGIIQLEGLTCTSLIPPGPRDYKELYTRPQWELDIASAVASLPTSGGDNIDDLELVDLCERLTYYYLRQLNDKIDRSEVPAMVWHFQRIFEWIDFLFPWIEEGTHPTIRKEWKSDTYKWLDQKRARFPDQVDLQLITAVGENLAEVVRGQTTMLEHMIKDDVLNRFYKFGLGFQRANGFMGRIAKQVAHRYPRMKILEIGAGTGGATKGILESLGTTFESYTFTDISTGFFEAAAEAFAPWVDKMIFKPLNAENDVIEQGYQEKTYDFIIASNVLHATKTLSETMRNVRLLLKPGGQLLLLEVTSEIVRVKLMMAGLSGWWLGGDDGRRYGPTITRDQWDSLLKDTGFSGVDHVINDFVDESKYMTSVMISQAVDSDVALLRQPLLTSSEHPVWTCPPITIVGGAFENVALRIVKTLSAVSEVASTPDLDEPVLQNFTQEKLAALQKSLPESRQLLVIALSTTHGSTISVPSGCVFKVAEGSSVATLLQDVTSALIADQLISDIPLGSTVVLHRSDKFLGAVLKRRAAKAGLSVKNVGLHKYASEKSLRDAIPVSTRLLVDFSATSHWSNSLPEGCVYWNVQDFFSHTSKGEPTLVAESVRRLVDLAQLQPSTSSSVDILPLSKLDSQSVSSTKYSTIIDFSDVSVIPAQTSLLDPSTLFRSDHTYLLAGCTGGLGKALCLWMASKGAKYFALTTRDPSKIDQLWLKELAALGAEVNLYGLDVADKDALTSVRDQIEEEMPPIAGVVNAAMVLSDRSFGELTAKDFRIVFGPKVDGTKNLDELFYDQPLDFFIMFSSLASIVGNRGQSNYVAANLFMSTIAEQRRRRGLAASVIHIGMVLGVGYVSSTGIYESTLRQYNYMPIPEQDFLDMFSEAIVVGRLESEHSPDLITGLNRHSLREDVQRPFWHEDLKFCHHTLSEVRQTESTTTNNMSLAQRLAQATSSEEAEELIREGFCTKLERMLQAAKGSIQVSQSLMNLGVDSLIAVEIRSWFLKELDVDVPVLKVLSGASVTDLSKEAASKVAFGAEASNDAASPAIAVEKESPRAVPQTTEQIPLIAPSAVTTAPQSIAPRGVSPPRSTSDVAEIETKIKREQLKLERVAEMSFAQRRLWFLRQFLQDPTTYNVTLSYSITGRLRINDFRDAFRKVIARHESLRTSVFSDAIFDVDYKTGTTVEHEFSKMRDYAVIIAESESKHFFVLGFHHLAFDGFSAQTLVKDLAMAYAGLPLSPLKHQYIDFANKEKTLTWSDDLEYWKSEFSELPEALPLFEFTETKARIPLTEYNTRALTQQLPDRIATQIKSAARTLNVTPFHFHLAITQTLLSRLLGITDNDSEFLDTIGFFVNLLPLRFKTDGAQSFATLTHSRVPFDKLLDELKVPRSTYHSPLFQVVVNYKMGSTQSFEDARNAYDLTFEIENFPDGRVLLALKTQDYLYTDHDLQTILAAYTHLLDVLSREPNLNVNTLARGETYEPAILHLPGWLDLWTAQQPGATAIRDDSVNSIAALLVEAGAKTSQRVGSYCEPSIDAICTMLAIQKLGCIYVPLDVQNPPSLIVYHDATELSVKQFETSASLVSISTAATGVAVVDVATIDPYATGYILYTSGTTGIPKGVMLSHSNLIYHIAGVHKKYGLEKETVLQQSSLGFDLSLAQICQAFFSGGTLVIALKETRRDPAQIAKLMLEEKITYTWMTPTEYSMIVRYGANYLRQSFYWRSAFSAGEFMSSNLLNSYINLGAPHLRLFNGCGPTEITINNCIGENELSPSAPRDTRNPSIGKSLPNYSTYILDEDLKPVPIGFSGEICVGGPAVAQGFVDRDELTAAKFQPDPYGPGHLYRTGDKAKFLPDGRLVFLGRIAGDTQVKLRGFRVELNDIANTIISASEGIVKDASVSFRSGEDSSEDFLAAFVVLAAKDHTVSDGTLEQLRSKLPLPAYMRPARIIAVDELPINSSGKRDRYALDKLPIPSISSVTGSGHLTETQEKLRGLWLEVVPGVNAARIGANTDFFAIGGNSLLMVKLRGLIAETFHTEISVFDLFQSSSLGNMASKVQSSEVDEVISWGEETSVQPLSVADGNVLQQVSDNLEVLLTGATGFLGSSILRQLVADERVYKVHCVALRGIHPLAVKSPKIIQYTGDLSQKMLGLSETEFSTLSSSVHRIIHNGATVSFLQSYSSLRAPNFESTKTLVSLAASRGIPLHYVSSAGVVKFTGLDGLPPISVSQYEPPTDGSNGYSATKWASEVYLEKVTENSSLPIWIHRPSSITGENAPETDLMQSVIKHSLHLKAIPDLSSWQGSFDFVPVNEVAAGLSFAHHCGKDKIPVQDIKLEVLSLEQWVDKAKARGLLDNATEVLINDVVGISDGKAILPSLL